MPGLAYACLGFCNAEVVLSPKSHNQVFIKLPLSVVLSVNTTESPKQASLTLKAATGAPDTLKSNSTVSLFPHMPATGLNTVAITEVSPGVL